jgi:hypothetical protein
VTDWVIADDPGVHVDAARLNEDTLGRLTKSDHVSNHNSRSHYALLKDA